MSLTRTQPLTSAAVHALVAQAAHLSWQGNLFTSAARRPAADPPSAADLPATTPGTPATPDTPGISARLAYQYAMYRRAVIVDARSQTEREADGRVHPSLAPLTPAQFTSAAPAYGSVRRIVILGDDHATTAATQLLNEAVPGAEIVTVVGGFAAWRQARLPIAA